MNRLAFLLPLIALTISITAQDKDQKIILITTDGLRWQEVFSGMDPIIAADPAFNQRDSIGLFQVYGDATEKGRRQKLMPFLWGTLAKQGQLYGNRTLGSKVDNANPYWFSYPGYSEILTGHVDTLINSNEYPPNPHTNLFEYLNGLPNYRSRIAAFASWGAFDRILNEQRAGFPVINAFDNNSAASTDPQMKMLSEMVRTSFKPWGMVEVLDVFTFYQAFTYLQKHRPKAMFLSFGDTDEFAHHGEYKHYLNAAHQFDEWVGEIWRWVQSQPDYRDRTTLLITTDHGRGDLIKKEWTSHGQSIKDASQIWFAVIGPKVKPLGEIKGEHQYFQQQLAQTLAGLAGLTFKANHSISPAISLETR